MRIEVRVPQNISMYPLLFANTFLFAMAERTELLKFILIHTSIRVIGGTWRLAIPGKLLGISYERKCKGFSEQGNLCCREARNNTKSQQATKLKKDIEGLSRGLGFHSVSVCSDLVEKGSGIRNVSWWGWRLKHWPLTQELGISKTLEFLGSQEQKEWFFPLAYYPTGMPADWVEYIYSTSMVVNISI